MKPSLRFNLSIYFVAEYLKPVFYPNLSRDEVAIDEIGIGVELKDKHIFYPMSAIHRTERENVSDL
jgi:hypothetical protein